MEIRGTTRLMRCDSSRTRRGDRPGDGETRLIAHARRALTVTNAPRVEFHRSGSRKMSRPLRYPHEYFRHDRGAVAREVSARRNLHDPRHPVLMTGRQSCRKRPRPERSTSRIPVSRKHEAAVEIDIVKGCGNACPHTGRCVRHPSVYEWHATACSTPCRAPGTRCRPLAASHARRLAGHPRRSHPTLSVGGPGYYLLRKLTV